MTPHPPAPDRGRFVVIDGVDGCGKTTQAERLAARLSRDGGDPLHVREPGGTRLGEAVRRELLEGEDLSPAVEALLVVAARRHLLERVVEPALAAGRDVVCERSTASTFAYQGVAGGLGGERILALAAEWTPEPVPDVVLLLELDPAEAARRRGADRDRIEARGVGFQAEVARGYAEYAATVERAVRVDAAREADTVEASVWEEVARAGAR